MQITLSALRTKLTPVLNIVKGGETVTILERGVPIAQIVPYAGPVRAVDILIDGGREAAKAAQRARDEILGKVNKKKP